MAHTVEVSACCRAELKEDFKDNPADHHDPIEIYKCSYCGHECEVEEVCEFCLGTGKIEGTDNEGHPSGYYKKCQECADDTSDPDK